jgi:hypothetical protein
MRIFLLYIVLGGLYFFQNYYSIHLNHNTSDGYGLSQYAILASIVLYLSGYFFLYHIKLGVFFALICNLVLIIHNINIYIGYYGVGQALKIGYSLVLSIFLQFLVVIHAFIYFFLANERLKNSLLLKSYFPLSIDKKLASIVGSAMVIVTAGIISILVLFTGVTRQLEREVSWKIEEDRFHRGKKVLLIFKEYPNYYFEFFSDNLANKLILSNQSTLNIKFLYSTDFGNLTGYKVLSIDNDSVLEYGFHLLTSECGNGFPECEGKPKAPWEGK